MRYLLASWSILVFLVISSYISGYFKARRTVSSMSLFCFSYNTIIPN